MLFARPKHLDLLDPAIAVSVKAAGDGACTVTLKSRHPALWTWLELDGLDARFSDNFLHLFPGEVRTLLVTPAKPLTPARMKKALRVRSLVDTYA